MERHPAANRANPLLRLWPWLVVLLVLLFVGFIRYRLRDMPLERDEGEYAYAGQLILQGIPTYDLAFNMKLPGAYFAYALGMAIFGETPAGIHLTLIVVNSLTIIFVFLLARKLFGVAAGLAACASYGVMSVSPTVLGLAAHANHFVVLWAVPATLLLFRADDNRSIRTLFFSGLLYGLAFMMKQQGMFFVLFGGIFLLWRAIESKCVFSRDFVRRSLVFVVGAGLPFGAFCLVRLVRGDFQRFWFWTVDYARWYATSLPLQEGIAQLHKHLEQTFFLSVGFWIFAGTGLLLAAFNQRLRKSAAIVVVLWFCSFLGTAAGLYFRGHYFILVLPAFAILMGLSVAAWQDALQLPRLQNVFHSLPLIFFGLLLYWAVFYQAQLLFQLTPLQVLQNLYAENPFQEAVVAGDYIREHSAPESTIAVIGSEPEIYFYAHRHSATGYIYTYALMEPQPAALTMQHEMIQEIETNRPEYLVFVNYGLSWLPYKHSNFLISDWATQYADHFYGRAGVIRNEHGTVTAAWGPAAEKADIKNQCLVIYRRKE